ncbi:enoyl-CoA hydratase/isomerase family protein [Herpetosiphon sp.]|uniref:Enoyl-CoA hydratase/isomerase n=1 Tax=Herpetosiphon aurantiacus (strain ATCC 23779 / DSM 785 / 114-95) TaxID=316274 RepID=A9AYA5_HERA2|nr:enoyl-CoA hydratase/isomerase family protein [Herpetosiphon sp.]ABX03487.1 Enoyl-CoA hydratase/isomerase [Herpetosiphon aurantiacus DSM 785]
MSGLVTTEQTGAIFRITLNRPEKRNAISWQVGQDLRAAIDQAASASGVRVVVLSGAGSVFSAGIDLGDLMDLPNRYGEHWLRQMRTITDDWQALTTRLERLEIPTIAALHGMCLGLGLEIALACDFRIAAQGTKLALPETRLGIVPDVGGTTRLTRLVGVGRAKELIMTGRTFSATDAERWGVVNQLADADDLNTVVQAFADELILAAPLAVGMAKRVIDGMFDVDRGLLLEGWAQSQLIRTADFSEGVQAAIARRAAEFKGE